MTAMLAAGVVCVVGAPPSRFNKNFDERKLDKEWAEDDVETDDWHEDSFEWREKQRKEVKFDPSDISSVMKAAGGAGGMQMCFASLIEGLTKDDSKELAARWQALLMTNGIRNKMYSIDEKQILVTEEDGHIFDVKDFMLAQPEVTKFRWKDTDYFPEKKKASKKKGSKKASTKKGSKKAKKEEEKSEL